MVKPTEMVVIKNATKNDKMLGSQKGSNNTAQGNATKISNLTSGNSTVNTSKNSTTLNEYTQKIDLIMNSFASDLKNISLAEKLDKNREPNKKKEIKVKTPKDSDAPKDMAKDVEK